GVSGTSSGSIGTLGRRSSGVRAVTVCPAGVAVRGAARVIDEVPDLGSIRFGCPLGLAAAAAVSGAVKPTDNPDTAWSTTAAIAASAARLQRRDQRAGGNE